jgi:hypothetical protein
MKRLLIAVVALSVLLLIAAVSLTAYVSAKASSTKLATLTQLKEMVARDLHDPESVRFRDLRLLTDSEHIEGFDRLTALSQKDINLVAKAIREKSLDLFTYQSDAFSLCGQLNAKNRMGAYLGYTDFYVMGTAPSKPFVIIEGSAWEKELIAKMCKIGTVVLQPPDDPGTK